MTTQVQADMAVKALTDEELDAINGGDKLLGSLPLTHLIGGVLKASSDSSKHMASTTSSLMAELFLL